MRRNGFTLIELLAVIVILSIVALMSTPLILNMIENVRKNAFLNTGYGIVSAGEYYYSTKGDTLRDVYNLVEGNVIPYKKGTLQAGQLKYNAQGKIALAIWDGKYCVVKKYEDDKLIIVSNEEVENCVIEKIDKVLNPGVTGYLCSKPGDIVPTPEEYFTFNQTTKTITGYSNEGPKDLVIPCTIGGIDVENIGSSAFKAKGITSVIMPDTIKTIGYSAFENNQITELQLGNSVEMIRQKAFKNNQITELVIPDSVKTIEGLYTTRGYGTFQTNQLTRVTFGSGIESIGDDAFVGNKITEVDFSRSTNLREIKSFAFQNSLIMDLNLSNLTQINILGKTSASQFTSLGSGWNGTCNNIIYLGN